jgi:hypothetical protein
MKHSAIFDNSLLSNNPVRTVSGQFRLKSLARGIMIRWVFKAAPILAAVQLLTAVSAFGADALSLDPAPPFAICRNQRYALCAAASCFVYNQVAYCKCDVLRGDSISLQLSYSSPMGDRNVCDVNQQGRRNGYMVSTFSLPPDVKKGGPAAVYTCPGTDDAGTGVPAPVAYGQCDGAMCFTSSRGTRFPGFAARLSNREIMCSCPVSTGATPGSSDPLGYQIFGPYHPKAPAGSRCDASACEACSVANPTANGASLKVGAPTGSGSFLTLRLDGSVPDLNECLCTCTTTSNVTTCTVGQDNTP